MSKKIARAKNKKLILILGAIVFFLLVAGATYLYQKNNLGSTDSDASGNKVFTVKTASISKKTLTVGESFEVSCDYNFLESQSSIANGVYVMGDGVSCKRGSPLNTLIASKQQKFTCIAQKEGKFALGCGIREGTTYLVQKKECKPFVSGGKSTKPELRDGKCVIPIQAGNTSGDSYPAYRVVGNPVITYEPVQVDVFNSYKVIDYITVGNPTGTNDCVVPVYVDGNVNRKTLSKKLDANKRTQASFFYKNDCRYAINSTIPKESVKMTADKATCSPAESGALLYKGKIVSDKDLMTSNCKPLSTVAVGDQITPSCNFVASTIEGVKICPRTDTLDKISIIK